MHLFGLTGGIASGKSQVARRFRERGVPVIDADQLAREVVLPGSPGLAEVVSAFGAEVLSQDGTLDRKKMGALIFSDESKRALLNGILHPRIGALGVQRAQELAEAGHELVGYEAALLVENGLSNAFRPLVVVAAPASIQAERTAARDGVTEAEALARIQAQIPLDEKVRVADVVVQNSGSLAELEAGADLALREVCRITGVSASRFFG